MGREGQAGSTESREWQNTLGRKGQNCSVRKCDLAIANCQDRLSPGSSKNKQTPLV